VVYKRVVCGCPVSICGRLLPANLVVLPMISYNIILKMVWLVKDLAIIDWAWKQVRIRPWQEGEVTYIGLQVSSLPLTILDIRAKKLILGGKQAFLAFIIAPMKVEMKDL
jgi:hypothetical protein